jgi:hypothetical protein
MIKKSLWIEVIEWCVLAAVGLFTIGVIVMRSEITAPPESGSTAPVESVDE